MSRLAVVPLLCVVASGIAIMVPSSFGAPNTSTAATSRHAIIADATVAVTQPQASPNLAAPGQVVSSAENQSDPFLYRTQDRYYLYTSEFPKTPIVNVPVASAVDFGAWSPVTDALPVLPRWAAPGFTWAPDVHQFGSTYVLYFTAGVIGTGQQCIGIATSTSPVGPFTAEQTPFVCQSGLGGSIDPRVFADADGTNWLLYKSDQNIGARPIPTTLWSQRLSDDGLSLIGPQHELMKPDEAWQGTIVEAPDMVEVNGIYWIFYAGNFFNLPKYAIGAARCQGPTGPCSDTSTQPLLSTNSQGKGPGEASVYLDATGAWMLYTPVMATGGNPPRPVMVTRIGFDTGGPYLAAGGPPPTIDPLGGPVWSAS